MKLACQEGMAPGESLKEKLDNLAQYGYEGIEFGGSGLEERQDEILAATENSIIKPSTICAGYGGCLLTDNEEERGKAVSDIKKLLTTGANIGVVGLIVVPIFGGAQLQAQGGKSVEQVEEEMLVKLLKKIGEHAVKVGCNVLLEPLNRYETHFIKRLEQGVNICEQVDCPNVLIMGDFFHMSIEEADIAQSIRDAGDWLVHIHLADSNRVLPGYGHTDFQAGFAALKGIGFDKYMALECGVPGDDKGAELIKTVRYMKQWI